MPCCRKGGTGASSCFILSKQVSNQKCRAKGFKSNKIGSAFCLVQAVRAAMTVHAPNVDMSDIHPWGQGLQLRSEPFCVGHCAVVYTHHTHKTSPWPKQLIVFKILSLSKARRGKNKDRSVSSGFLWSRSTPFSHPHNNTFIFYLSPFFSPMGWVKAVKLPKADTETLSHHITSLKVLGREKKKIPRSAPKFQSDSPCIISFGKHSRLDLRK